MCVCVFTPQAVCFYAVSIFNVHVNMAVYECLSVCVMHDVLFTRVRPKEKRWKKEVVARQKEKEKQRHLASERDDKSDEERR